MKIQELAIIFVIIILPISILLSEYTQFQIQTIKTQTEYDTKLTTATYDAIKAFQLNAKNETYSDLANERVQDIERSVKSFRNSIMSSFKLNGYTEDELNNYIPALVYTLYDGLYIYSPYENTNYRYKYEVDPNTGEIKKNRYTGEPIYEKDADGNKIPTEGNGEQLYGLKPYISYSCRYITGNIDVVITYTLDNYITVQGMIGSEYVNRSGYLIDNITVTENGVLYNGVEIETEQLKENVGGNTYPYVKRNGEKYYLVGNQIVSISNGEVTIQCSEGDKEYTKWVNRINYNTYAQQYYKEAEEFTKWFKSTNLVNLTYNDAYDEVIDENTGATSISPIWAGNTTKVFDFNTGTNAKDNIENELSNFNQHRLAIIRHKIETNLAIAISNYNSYSNVENVFQLQKLKEDEWDQITHNISLISFLQGLPIGGKIYNGYTIVTNSESKEVVLEQNIYILGKDKGNGKNYHKIGDNNLEVDDSGVYGNKISTGRLNTDFKRQSLTNSEGYQTLYYYPLKAYNASYNSVVMQNDVTTYDDIYEYVNTQNEDLKKAFYTALGRERYGMYRDTNEIAEYSILVVGTIGNENYNFLSNLREITSKLDREDGVDATYIYSLDKEYLTNYVKTQKKNYDLIIIDSFVWSLGIDIPPLSEVFTDTNIITISNDSTNLPMMQSATTLLATTTPVITNLGRDKLGNISITGTNDTQAIFRFKSDVEVFYTGMYSDGQEGDLIGCWKNENCRWIHSQVSLNYNDKAHMKLLRALVNYALDRE